LDVNFIICESVDGNGSDMLVLVLYSWM